MRLSRQTSTRTTAAQPPVRRIFSFTCACCGLTENCPTPDAPAGWVVECVDDEAFVFCPQDALNHKIGGMQ